MNFKTLLATLALGLALSFAHLDQTDIVRQPAINQLVGVHRIQQPLPFAHQLLRLGRIIPQVRILNHRVEFLKAVRGGVPIHPLRQKLQGFADNFHIFEGFRAHEIGFPMKASGMVWRGDTALRAGGQGCALPANHRCQ